MKMVSFNFGTILLDHHLVLGELKTSNFYQAFLLIATFRKLYFPVYCYFLELVIKLI